MTTTDLDITRPLRLAVGSHSAGSGKGCAMNLISWENGDKTITDLPDCADPMLAKIVQRVNLLNFGAKAVPPFSVPHYPIRIQAS